MKNKYLFIYIYLLVYIYIDKSIIINTHTRTHILCGKHHVRMCKDMRKVLFTNHIYIHLSIYTHLILVIPVCLKFNVYHYRWSWYAVSGFAAARVHFSVRKGAACHERIVEALLGGMNMKPDDSVLLVDCLPNRHCSFHSCVTSIDR